MTAADRTYFRFARAWHALASTRPAIPGSVILVSSCGQLLNETWAEQADRIPADGHMCGSCSRVVLARTDVEPPRVEGVPV